MKNEIIRLNGAELRNKHEEMVASLVKSGGDIVNEMTSFDAHLMHMVVGICGEAGELLDAIKKKVIYGSELDLINVIEELGDMEFYMQGLRSSLKVTREDCLRSNMDKLFVRYKGFEYSNEAALNRLDKNEKVQKD